MSFRGPALSYKIRKTTINNKTGDNYAITIPSFLAKQFSEIYFRINISGNSIIFESGCKLTINYIEIHNEKKIYTAGGLISLPK